MKTQTPAQAIKKELKQAFPNTKFSCKYSFYAGGDSVTIYWLDGPTEKEVNSIVCKYTIGFFDSMTDIYEYSNSRDDIPQTKYISTSRSMSLTTKDVVLDRANKIYDEELHRQLYLSPNNMAYRLFREYAITSNIIEIVKKRNDNKMGISGQYEVICL